MLRFSLLRFCQAAQTAAHSSSVVGMAVSAGSSSSTTAAPHQSSYTHAPTSGSSANSSVSGGEGVHVAQASSGSTTTATSGSPPKPESLQAALANAPTLMRNNYNGIRKTLHSGNITATLPPLTSVIPFTEAIDTEKVKYVLLYFSASWCPPCRQFTPVLADFYNKHKDAKNFEVVFCSWDQSDADFAKYLKSHPDWLAIDRTHVDALAAIYDIRTIPAVIIVDAQTGELITYKGRFGVSSDPAGKNFPWRNADFPKHVNVNAPRNAMMIGAAATFGASLLLYLFAQDRSVLSGANETDECDGIYNNNNNNNNSNGNRGNNNGVALDGVPSRRAASV